MKTSDRFETFWLGLDLEERKDLYKLYSSLRKEKYKWKVFSQYLPSDWSLYLVKKFVEEYIL